MIKHYSGLLELAEEAESYLKTKKTKWLRPGLETDPWHGSISSADAIRKTIYGDDSLVAAANKIIDDLDIPDINGVSMEWGPSPYGLFPIVPDYISGAPDSMRNKLPTPSIYPIKIFASTTPSAYYNKEQIIKRGTAILALTLKIQSFRPVELCLLSELDGQKDQSEGSTILVIPVDSKPLCVAQACFAMCNVAFARQICFGVSEVINDYGGGWPKNYTNNNEWYFNWLSREIGVTKEDIYIRGQLAGGSRNGSTDDNLIFSDPRKWITDTVMKYNKLSE